MELKKSPARRRGLFSLFGDDRFQNRNNAFVVSEGRDFLSGAVLGNVIDPCPVLLRFQVVAVGEHPDLVCGDAQFFADLLC